MTRYLLKLDTTESHDYEPARVLRVYHALAPEIERGWFGDAHGYQPSETHTDETRICDLFDLLNGSIFGDWLFSSSNGPDSGKELLAMGDDE